MTIFCNRFFMTVFGDGFLETFFIRPVCFGSVLCGVWCMVWFGRLAVE